MHQNTEGREDVWRRVEGDGDQNDVADPFALRTKVFDGTEGSRKVAAVG